MSDRDIDNLREQYTPQELMATVKQARDYLRAALNGLVYEGYPIEVRMNHWGMLTKDGIYQVCLGGLWHLLQVRRLTTHSRRLSDRHPLVALLNVVRYRTLSRDTVLDLLGIDTEAYAYPPDYECDDPVAVLTFLDWLVEQDVGNNRE